MVVMKSHLQPDTSNAPDCIWVEEGVPCYHVTMLLHLRVPCYHVTLLQGNTSGGTKMAKVKLAPIWWGGTFYRDKSEIKQNNFKKDLDGWNFKDSTTKSITYLTRRYPKFSWQFEKKVADDGYWSDRHKENLCDLSFSIFVICDFQIFNLASASLVGNTDIYRPGAHNPRGRRRNLPPSNVLQPKDINLARFSKISIFRQVKVGFQTQNEQVEGVVCYQLLGQMFKTVPSTKTNGRFRWCSDR